MLLFEYKSTQSLSPSSKKRFVEKIMPFRSIYVTSGRLGNLIEGLSGSFRLQKRRALYTSLEMRRGRTAAVLLALTPLSPMLH